ncbi:MAG: glycosyltransferase family 39 protein [Bacteroidia bacterium]|nr:glycosyltransferase family 39 protein [Bacteroidia bacterium]
MFGIVERRGYSTYGILLFVALAVSFLLRFYLIDSTVIGWHSWRQSDTAAIARNFHQVSMNILQPRADWGGGLPVEAEFQLFPYLIALLYRILGESIVIARLLPSVFMLAAAWGIFRLGGRWYNERVGVMAASLYALLPLNLFYGRAVMPEAMMLCCIVYGLLYFDRWLETKKWSDAVLAYLSVSVAVLLKLPTLWIGLPLLVLIIARGGMGSVLRPAQVLFAVAVLLPVAAWYWHAHGIFLETGNTFGIWTGETNKWGELSSLLSLKYYNDIFFKSIAERHLTYPVFLLMLYGLYRLLREKRNHITLFWMLAVIVFFFVVRKGNQVHEYYQLPFTQPAVLIAAVGIDDLLTRVARAKLLRAVLIAAGCLVLALSGFRYAALLQGERNTQYINDAQYLRSELAGPSRIAIITDGNPVLLYVLGKHGWIVNCAAPDVPDAAHFIVVENATHEEHCASGILDVGGYVPQYVTPTITVFRKQ